MKFSMCNDNIARAMKYSPRDAHSKITKDAGNCFCGKYNLFNTDLNKVGNTNAYEIIFNGETGILNCITCAHY